MGRRPRWMILLVLLAIAGCSKSPTTGDVRLTVNLDGGPLTNGTVRLVAKDGNSPTIGGNINDGLFEGQAPIASYAVQISSTKLGNSGKRLDKHDLTNPSVTQLIPAKYNTRTELELEVKRGQNEKTFDLNSQ
ncbi:MAG: hypothetical protein IT427_03260 [Pirellulales bacterium]|nr:hypothetical protein [Pirellulales bacterium]